jgi:hypothetical protein
LHEPSLSPSLERIGCSDGSAKLVSRGAYELKYLIARDKAERMMEEAMGQLALDPYCTLQPNDGGLGKGYWIESLYLDSNDLSVYHRRPGHTRRKYRIRKYGSGDQVFVERKSKRRGLVKKRRTVVSHSDLKTHIADASSLEEQDANWFYRRVARRGLQPTIRVGYFRRALMGTSPTGTIRMTLDTQVCFAPEQGFVWSGSLQDTLAPELFPQQTILELKFREALPLLYRQWIERFELGARSCSKYRTAMQASGILTASLAGRSSVPNESYEGVCDA